MSCQLCPPDLHPVLERVNTACKHTLDAVVALAEALGTPSSVPDAVAEAEDKVKEAEDDLQKLEAASNAVVAPAVARGTLGDEDDEELQRKANMVEEKAKELEERKKPAQQCQKWLQAGHGLAMGLTVLCGALLSVEAIRSSLGMAQDSHLLVALGAVAVSCQVAAQALGTSQEHLDDIAREHRDKAEDLRDRARRVATARARAEAAAATHRKIGIAQDQLDAVKGDLSRLVKAVKWDMAREGQKFNKAAGVLEDIVVALMNSSEGHEEVTRRLQNALTAVRGQR